MKKLTILITIILLSSVIYSQQIYTDVIYLKNGDIVKGVIIENAPNDYVKLETDNGSIITFKYVDILKFTKEKTSKNSTIKQNKSTEIEEPYNSPHKVQVTPSEYNYPMQYSSIAFGYGNSYGGLGAKFEHRFGTVAIHGGVGYFPAPADYAESSILFSGGIKLFLSKSSSYYIDLQFGTFGVEAKQFASYTSYSTTTTVTQKILYGPSILFGNTRWFSETIGLNGAIGASYNMEEIEWTDEMKILFALDLGLVIKF